MQPPEHAPDTTQQTVFEDRISRRIHDRITLMPGVSDRNDGAHRIGRLDHPGVSDRGLAASVQRRWLRTGATTGAQDNPMPYVHAQRKGMGMDVALSMEATSPLPHELAAAQHAVAGQHASGAQASTSSPTTSASGAVRVSTAGPPAGAGVTGAADDLTAHRASAAEPTLPIVHAQRCVTAPPPVVDAHVVNPAAQRQPLAQAISPSPPGSEIGGLAGVQRFPADPSVERSPGVARHTASAETQRFSSVSLPGEAGGVVTPSTVRTENRTPTQRVQVGSHPVVLPETPPAPPNSVAEARAAGVTRAVESTAIQTAVTWGAPIVQRRMMRQRDALALQDAGQSTGGALPATAETAALQRKATGSEGARGVDARNYPVPVAASSAVTPAIVQRRAGEAVMAAPLHTPRTPHTAPDASGMLHAHNERATTVVASVSATESLRTLADRSVKDAHAVSTPRATTRFPAGSAATTNTDAAGASAPTASGDARGVPLHSARRSSAGEPGSSPTVIQLASAVATALPSAPVSTSALVLRTKTGETDAAQAAPTHGAPPASASPAGAELSNGRPLVHASSRRAPSTFAPALTGQPMLAGLSRDGVVRAAVFGAAPTPTLVMRRAEQIARREADSAGDGGAFATFVDKTQLSSPVVQIAGPARADSRPPQWVAASRYAFTGATQLASVVQASPSTMALASDVGSALPLHQGYMALASSASSLLMAPDRASSSPAHAVTTPGALTVQRQPAAPTSTPAGASTSDSGTAAHASPAAQTTAQSPPPESVDLERIASAVYRIIRDRLIVERESRGL